MGIEWKKPLPNHQASLCDDEANFLIIHTIYSINNIISINENHMNYQCKAHKYLTVTCR
jgi:hypothetical protein